MSNKTKPRMTPAEYFATVEFDPYWESIAGARVLAGARAAEAAKLIDIENCELVKVYSVQNDCSVSDAYVRGLPDGQWVHQHALPEATYAALEAAIDAGRFIADGHGGARSLWMVKRAPRGASGRRKGQ